MRLEKLASSSSKRKEMSAVSPAARKRLRRLNITSNDNSDPIFLKLLNHESPRVEGQRCCLRHIVVLTQIDCESRICKCSFLKLMSLLSSASHCVSSSSADRKRVRLFNSDNSALPDLGDEGLTEVRLQMAAQSELSNFN